MTLIERLERRQFLDATLQDGLLTISGTQFSDTFEVSIDSTNILVRQVGINLTRTFEAFLVNRIVANLGGGRDRLVVDSSLNKPILANGGKGRDLLSGGAGRDSLNGGNGNDQLKGSGGADLLSGGPDDDILSGNRGNDRLDGGPGADLHSGGSGSRDIADYRRRRDQLTITIGDDNDNDGEQNENDEILDDIEVVFGGRANDIITGSDRSQQLFGGPGGDTLDGGDGPDSLHGEAGDDFLIADDGDKDFVNGASVNGQDDSKNDQARTDDLDLLRGIDQVL